MKSKLGIPFTLIILISLTNCAQNIAELSPPASRLTSAVQGVCERPADYGFPNDGSSEMLLTLATEDDPTLLTPFKDVTLKSQCIKANAILMICDSEEEFKLIEDCGSTAIIDKNTFKDDEPCRFSPINALTCI